MHRTRAFSLVGAFYFQTRADAVFTAQFTPIKIHIDSRVIVIYNTNFLPIICLRLIRNVFFRTFVKVKRFWFGLIGI